MKRISRLWGGLAVGVFVVALVACGSPSSSTSHATPAAAAMTTPFDASAEDAYLTQLTISGAFRGSVLISQNGVVLLNKGYGQADEASDTANTPQTRFRIGSITKQFTAMAILILQERGKLRVGDHVCQYVPNCPADWQPLTLQHLLTHTSGIPDYLNSPDFLAFIDKPTTPAQLVARFKNMPLQFTPGAQFSYSNSGYVLLGYIIERVAGETYAQFLQQNIFDRLQMRESGYDGDNQPLPLAATGYDSPHVQASFMDASELFSAAGLYSTVGDLERWDQALATHRLVSQQALDAMFTVYIPCPSGGCGLKTDQGYGYGWFIARESNQRLIYHVGHIDGFLTFNGFYPDSRLDVIVLSNLDAAPVLPTSVKLGALVLGTA
jgi:CubicO group peptidase (beta-lactamase class C family)